MIMTFLCDYRRVKLLCCSSVNGAVRTLEEVVSLIWIMDYPLIPRCCNSIVHIKEAHKGFYT